ncbi:MAG: hypothetical protein HQ567_24855 [Candidatus Nealsonbacteria bacterium]|nr:hypothetical protein [Candidatus Nealsonbacteria bacterium]
MRLMKKSKLAGVVLVFGVLLAAKTTFAQATRPNPEAPKSLADRLDDFSRTVFGGILPDNGDNSQRTRATESRSATKKFIAPRATRASDTPTTRSILSPSAKRPSTAGDPRGLLSDPRSVNVLPRSAPEYPEYGTDTPRYSPPPSGRVSNPVQPVRRVPLELPGSATTPPRATPTVTADSAAPARTYARPVPRKTDPLGLSNLANPVLRPLHERLESSKESVFTGATPAGPAAPAATGDAAVSTGSAPGGATHGEPTLAVRPTPGDALNPVARQPRTIRNPAATSPRIGTQPNPSGTRPDSEVTSPAEASASPPLRPTTPSATSPSTTSQLIAAPQGSVGRAGQGVLLAQTSPVLGVRTTGPKRISVGKEATYQVTIQNSGDEAADEVVVFVQLPDWADVMGAQTRTGAMRTPPPGETVGPLEWEVGNLPARGSETLLLRIIPRERRPFDLGVRFAYKPVASQTMIEVQEPKLEMSLNGPRDILFGKKELYRLQLANVGNGDAENVMIKLLPIGGVGGQAVSHHLGTLQAGQQRAIEVELTARQVGDLKIRVDVAGDAGLHAELAEDVFVRRAGLKIDVQGPSVQYVGTEAEYRVQVRNSGTATAHNLQFAANIPTGAKYLSGIEGVQISGNGTKLQWAVKSLNAASEQTFVFKCSLGTPGANRIEILSAADGDLNAAANAVTRVEAMADLVLDVKDPTGPVPVGQGTFYELRIRNRGTKSAAEVQVVGYFSRGIEPVKGDGGPHRIAAGQIVFSPIPSVAPGKEVVLKIHARAEIAGNHVFRAEVHCKPLGTRLVSEETTYFYADESASRVAAQPIRNATPPSPAPPNRPLRSDEPASGPLRSKPPVRMPITAGAPTGLRSATAAPPALPAPPATQLLPAAGYNPAAIGRAPVSSPR